MKKDDITCEIVKIHKVLSESQYGKKVLGTFKWNGGAEKIEIRILREVDGETRVTKGISLTDDEMEKLVESCKQLKKNRKASSYDSTFSSGVDLNAIYAQADGIIEKRSHGNRTMDGFYVIEPKKKK